MAKNKILITGHKGFIGSHLFNEINAEGIDLKEGKDILDLTPFDLEGIDYIFHFAAFPKVPYSIDHPIETNRNNIDATLHLLDCAAKARVKRLIYSASSSAYGNQDTLPLTEDMKPNPLSPYAVQKLTGEYYCKLYSEIYGLETVCLRYFNVYGEGMKVDDGYSACLALFIDAKKKGLPLTVLGGKQTRDFTYVKDVINANILASKSNKVGKGEVINIGSGENYSIEEIAKTISDTIIYKPQRQGEPMDTRADISKAKELLNWSPSMNLLKWLKNLKND
jgi:nucleoside-diphosphate-sugar epimerase